MVINLLEFQEDTDAWKKKLEGFQQENVEMKHRLSEILKKEVNAEFLERAEHFQNDFLSSDESNMLLRRKIIALNKLLRQLLEDKSVAGELMKKRKQLAEEMELEERDFDALRSAFHKYLEAAD